MAAGLYKCFDPDKAQVIGFIDVDESKQGMKYESVDIMGPDEALLLPYDFIFISSAANQKEIFENALLAGIDREKLVSAAITKMELGRVYDLFTEKGMMYISHLKTENDIWSVIKELQGIKREISDIKKEGSIVRKTVSHIEKETENIHKEHRMRYANLFLKEYYEQQAAEFIIHNFISGTDAPGKNVIFEDRNSYYNYVLDKVAGKDGLYLEFGVYKGGSINYISNRIGDNIIYGFDSFEGLPEGWLPGYSQGKFDEKGMMPQVNKNVILVKGWFNETLPEFIKGHREEQCAFINIDCDLYSSAKCVLSLLSDHIGKGTIICFDELAGQIGWQDDEYKALMEFMEETGKKFRYIACAFGGGHQLTERVAIEVL